LHDQREKLGETLLPGLLPGLAHIAFMVDEDTAHDAKVVANEDLPPPAAALRLTAII
jgi:hypothetical protein